MWERSVEVDGKAEVVQIWVPLCCKFAFSMRAFALNTKIIFWYVTSCGIELHFIGWVLGHMMNLRFF
jgi:hypothetical protein